LADTGEHPWAYLNRIMESEDEIRPALTLKHFVGSAFTLNGPTNFQ
jgi:hypothetical protein